MAKTIQVDYARVSLVSNRFGQSQESLHRLEQQLQQQINQLRQGGWISTGAKSFYSEVDDYLLPALVRCVRAMQLAQETMDMISNEFEAAEDEARRSLESQMGELAQNTKSTFNHSNEVSELRDGTRTGDPIEKADIIFVNGIQTGPTDHLKTLDILESEFSGKNITGIYNQTDDMGIDTVQAINDRYGVPQNNPAVSSLKDGIISRLQNPGEFEIVAHSQGAAITSEALRQLSAEGVDLSRVKVTTLGGFGINFPHGVETHHYIHPIDAVGMASVIEDPKVREHTTVMINWEGGDISGPADLIGHGASDYIHNIEEFRMMEAGGWGRISNTNPIAAIGYAIHGGKEVVNTIGEIARGIF